MSIHNRLLFSEIFFKQIRRETADLANLRTTLATIRDTWRYYLYPPEGWTGPRRRPDAPFDADDATAPRDRVIQPIFGALELTYGPCEAQVSLSSSLSAFFLYGDWVMQDRTGLCLVLPYSADIEGRDASGRIPKGRNYAQQLLRLLRQYDLDWGVLTNGRQLAKKREEPAFTLPLGTFQVALDQVLAGYRELYARDSEDVEEVRQKARIYDQEIRPILERYRYLLSILNATPSFFYLRSRAAALEDAQRQAYLRFFGQYMESLPVPCIAYTTPANERRQLLEDGVRIAIAWSEQKSDGVISGMLNASDLGRWLDARLTADPGQTDVVHDLLAHLAREMTDLHRQKQAEVKRFLAWMEDELLREGIGMDSLSGKTFLQSYHEHPPEKLVNVLNRNQDRLCTSPEAAVTQLRLAYEESLNVLQPLMRRIARTDRLIDFIVYRLYNLTSEEVEVVEGARPEVAQ